MLAATIITRNIVSQEHRLNPDGEITTEDAERARLRQEMFDQARGHYLAALEGMRAQMSAGQRRDDIKTTPARTPTNPPIRARVPPPRTAGFIVDAALDFAVGGMIVLLENDPVLRAIANQDQDAMGAAQVLALMDVPLANATQKTRNELIASRRSAAQAKVTPAARSDAYVGMSVAHTDDPQTAHDTLVNGCLRGIVTRLRQDQGDSLPSLDSIVRDITTDGVRLSGGRKDMVADVLEVVKKAREGQRNIAVNVTDGEALSRVWLRADDKRNKNVQQKMRQAAFDSLYSCWENGITGRKIVCVNGRTSRMLSSLVLLDFDERNWAIATIEQLKNDIFAACRLVIDQEAQKAAASTDPNMRKAGLAQLAKTPDELTALGPIDPAANEQFIKLTQAAIARMVDVETARMNEHADGAISQPMIEGIKSEAIAAVV